MRNKINQVSCLDESSIFEESYIHKFDLFDLKSISPDKAHIALEIMQDHLKELNEYLNILLNKFDNLTVKYIDQSNVDKEVCNLLKSNLKNIDRLTNKVRNADAVTQKTAKSLAYDISKILTPVNSNSSDYSLDILKQLEIIKKEKSNVILAKDQMAHLFLHTIYYNLNNDNDKIESSTIELLVALLLNSSIINPKIVKEVIIDYNLFIENISNFDPIKARLDLANDVLLRITNILKIIDPENIANQKIAGKYKHLVPFAYWTRASSNLIIALNRLSELNKENNSKIEEKEKGEQKLRFLLSIIKDEGGSLLCDKIESETMMINSILSFIEKGSQIHIDSLSSKTFPYQISHEAFHQNILEEESEDIQNLYKENSPNIPVENSNYFFDHRLHEGLKLPHPIISMCGICGTESQKNHKITKKY